MRSVLRRDVRVPNESDGFVFTSARMRGTGLSPGHALWEQLVLTCDLLPLAVDREDPANVRVVVGGELEAAERAEWVGQVRSGLRVPDGKLALCGGIAYLLEPDDWAEGYGRVVPIPPGDYRATVYCYASAPNGQGCVERSGRGEALGAWFRRTRPGQTMPPWLHNLCVSDPGLDPGHATLWKRAKEKRGGQVVDFLLHLEPAPGPLTAAEVAPHGFVEAGDCRQPEPFPLGVPAGEPGGGEGGEVEEDEGDDGQEAPPDVPDVQARVAGDARQPIDGGAVSVPVVKLARLARIAWMCHPYTQPALRITFPGPPPRLEEVENAVVRGEGRTVQIGFVDTGQPAGGLDAVVAVARQLSAVPDGTVIELDMARRTPADRVGRHRYRGLVQGGGWQVAESFPPTRAWQLREALALSEALENGRRLVARDEDEAARIEARVARCLADYFGANSLQRTGAELALKRRDPTLFAHVVARVFWMRYADSWPLQDEDA